MWTQYCLYVVIITIVIIITSLSLSLCGCTPEFDAGPFINII